MKFDQRISGPFRPSGSQCCRVVGHLRVTVEQLLGHWVGRSSLALKYQLEHTGDYRVALCVSDHSFKADLITDESGLNFRIDVLNHWLVRLVCSGVLRIGPRGAAGRLTGSEVEGSCQIMLVRSFGGIIVAIKHFPAL